MPGEGGAGAKWAMVQKKAARGQPLVVVAVGPLRLDVHCCPWGIGLDDQEDDKADNQDDNGQGNHVHRSFFVDVGGKFTIFVDNVNHFPGISTESP